MCSDYLSDNLQECTENRSYLVSSVAQIQSFTSVRLNDCIYLVHFVIQIAIFCMFGNKAAVASLLIWVSLKVQRMIGQLTLKHTVLGIENKTVRSKQ